MTRLSTLLAALVASFVLSSGGDAADCGLPPITPSDDGLSSRVINGVVARPFSWPWQAAIYGFGFNCGGSVIDNQWILTAGHCVNIVPPRQMRVKLGVFDRSANEPGSLTATVLEVHRHPNYTIVENYYATDDIALIKLTEPITYSDQIQPVCLPSDDGGVVVNDSTQMAVMTGWGKTQNNGGVSSVLRQARVAFVPATVCQKLYVDYHDAVKPEVMICAGGTKKSVCNGDSGGPIVHKNAASGRYYQYGVASFVADKCFDKTHPSVFTRLQHYCDFIEQTVGKTLCG